MKVKTMIALRQQRPIMTMEKSNPSLHHLISIRRLETSMRKPMLVKTRMKMKMKVCSVKTAAANERVVAIAVQRADKFSTHKKQKQKNQQMLLEHVA